MKISARNASNPAFRSRGRRSPTYDPIAETEGVDPLKNESSIFGGTANLVAATISIGLVSYAVISVGSRTFEDNQLAVFLSLWALVNTLGLSLANPLETLAPQVLTNGSTEPPTRRLLPHPLVSHAILFGLVAGLGTLIVGSALSSEVTWGLQSGVVAFGVSIGLWSGRRAMWLGSGDFARARNGSFLNATVSLGLLAVVFAVSPDSVMWLFVAVAVGNVVGGTLWPRGPLHFESERRFFLPMDLYRVLWVLIGATGVTLVLAGGSLALAGAWGIESERVVVYAAMLSLVRIPMMLLNNVMGPLNLRINRLSVAGDIRSVRRLVIGGTGLICLTVPVLVGATALLGPIGVNILVGSEYQVSATFAAGVMLTEGVVWIGLLPRFVLAALRANRVIAYCWFAGLAAFALSAVLLPSSEWKLVLVPLISALVILAGAVPMTFVVLRSVDLDAKRELQADRAELSDS